MTINAKGWLAIGFMAAILLVLLVQFKGCKPAGQIVNVDSIVAPYQYRIDSIAAREKAQAEKILNQNFKIRQDSSLIANAIVVGKQSNAKLSEAIEANKALKAANDTLSRLNNCDTMAAYASQLQIAFDSVSGLIPRYETDIANMVIMYDDALKSANDKALEMTRRADVVDSILRVTPPRTYTEDDSPFSLGGHIGYGLTNTGTSPVASVGLNIDFWKAAKKLFKRKNK